MVAARSLPNAQLAAAYAGAGVVLNDHHEGMRTGGFVSNRLFDAVASGARVVTDELDGLPGGLVDLFGDAVRTYRTAADLAALVAGRENAFGDLGTRLATAERVRREHSFAARAARLIEVAHEARRTRGLTAG